MSYKTMYLAERVQLQQTSKTAETKEKAQANRKVQKTAKKKKRKGETINTKKGARKGRRMAKRKYARKNENRRRAGKKNRKLSKMTLVSITNRVKILILEAAATMVNLRERIISTRKPWPIGKQPRIRQTKTTSL